ncbi:MAG TPA: bifunctional demethylmenaquinone methyltransferase/2-methoxy-6-polyprenyl-1,4-benzoquinol methylase UbiE [Bacteroidota bacterium]|nr:bifunctional demethylmenaquinone methyltransferase/2-methoxy-6-polyprenyl-1,4-benzoquinol methylase UbiE [Bacteroidota bacterium]
MQKQYVRSLFDSIARRYDLLNHLLSGGIDVYWRHRAIEHLRAAAPRRILDVATGTADFALAALRLKPQQIVGVDIAEQMLTIGRGKVARRNAADRISLESGDAEHLSFADGSFDAAMVAFGARNFENLGKGLREMRRVLRPGGTILVLEFSRPEQFPFRQIYLAYFRRILPLIGRLVSRSPDAYAYLPETVMNFPQGEAFKAVLRESGFRDVAEDRLTLGIATIYTATR